MMTIAWILIAIGSVASFVGFIILVIAAFRVSIGWGLAILFLSGLLIPLILFLVKYWPEAKNGFLIQLVGWVLSAVGVFVLVGSMASAAMAELEDFEIPQELRQGDFESLPSEPGTFESEPVSEPASLPPTPTPLPTPEPTPTPVDEGPATYELEAAVDEDLIEYDDLEKHVGALVEIRLKDGSRARVRLESVTPDKLRVNQRLGGGSMSYSINRDTIKEIRKF
jgi:hypothetical protein